MRPSPVHAESTVHSGPALADCHVSGRSPWGAVEPLTFTHGLWQQVLDKFRVVPDMQDAVNALVHQFFLVIPQILRHVLGHEHHIAF